MASGWNLWVWLECIGVVSGCCCKEVYRYPHNDYRNSLNFHCKNIFIRRKHTKLFYSKFLLQRIFFGQIFRTKQVRVCSACSFHGSPDPGRLYIWLDACLSVGT